MRRPGRDQRRAEDAWSIRSRASPTAGIDGAIPENVFIKPPSAELRPDQKDTDSACPTYDVLDPHSRRPTSRSIRRRSEIAEELELPLALVRDIVNKVDRNEYKRQQAAPGLKVTTKAFGIGRRFPIAQRYRGIVTSVLYPENRAFVRFAFIRALCVIALSLTSQPAEREQVGPQPDGSFLLKSGWRVKPAGTQIPLDTLPMSSALSKDGKYLLVLNGGYRPPSISVMIAGPSREVSARAGADAWLGLAFSPDGKHVYASAAARRRRYSNSRSTATTAS